MINLRKYENLAFNVFIITSYILTAFFLTGVSTKSKEYLYTIDKYVKIYKVYIYYGDSIHFVVLNLTI